MASIPAPSSPIYHLSQELVDKLIDTLFISYAEQWAPTELIHRDLASCSLVCQSFLPRAQKHLFSHIKLAMDDYMRLTALAKIIDRRPAISSYIEKLSVIIRQRRSTGIYSRAELGRIMDNMIAIQRPLRSLELEGYPCAYDLPNPSDLITHFIRPYIAPYITSLRLTYLRNVPPELVSSCINLEELCILYSIFLTIHPKERGVLGPRIKFLEFGGNNSEIQRVCSTSHLDLSTLSRLDVRTDKLIDLADIQQIIDQSEGCLEGLDIRTYAEQDTILSSTVLDLGTQPHIHTLSYIAFFDGPGFNSLTGLCDTLTTIAARSDLTTLGLTIHIGLGNPVELKTMQELVITAGWEALGREIIRIAAAGKLFTFWLKLDYYEFWDDLDSQEFGAEDGSHWRQFKNEAKEVEKKIFTAIEQRLGIHDSISFCFNTTLIVK